MFSRKKGEEPKQEGRQPTPEEVMANKLLQIIGGEIIKKVNQNVVEILKPIRSELERLDARVSKLEQMSKESFREILRTVFDVRVEAIAEDAVVKAFDIAGIEDKLKMLEQEKDSLFKAVSELSEMLEIVEQKVGALRVVADEFSKTAKTLEKRLYSLDASISNILENFGVKIDEIVRDAENKIMQAVVVDKAKIELALEGVVKKTLTHKLEEWTMEIERRMNEVKNAFDNMSAILEKLTTMETALSSLSDEVKELKQQVSFITHKVQEEKTESQDVVGDLPEAKKDKTDEEMFEVA